MEATAIKQMLYIQILINSPLILLFANKNGWLHDKDTEKERI